MLLVCSMMLLELLSSCAVLTKSQVDSVNQFATLANEGSSNTEKVLNTVVEQRYNTALLERLGGVNPIADPNLTENLYNEIAGEVSNKRKEMKAAKNVTSSLNVLVDYTQALKKLSSPDFGTNLIEAVKALGKSIDELNTQIPSVPKAGNLITKTVSVIGGKYIGQKQTKALKEYIMAGAPVVDAICKYNETFLQDECTKWLIDAKQTDSTNINNFFKSVSNDRYQRYQIGILGVTLVETHQQKSQLIQQYIKAFQQIRVTNAQLLQSVQSKQNLTESSKELFELYKTIKDIRATYQLLFSKS